MHSAVLQNADYIKFASDNTVEVIVLGSLQEAVDQKKKGSERYEAEVDGKKIERMVEWPNLTLDEMLALAQSKGQEYNQTGKIPYTSVVDPHDLSEVKSLPGGSSSGKIIEAANETKKILEKKHGKSVPRKEYKALLAAESDSTALTAQGEFAKALASIDSAAKNAKSWPKALTDKVDAAKKKVIDAAGARLTEVETLADSDPVAAKKDLDKLANRLKGTGLEPRAKELVQKLAAG